MLAEAVEPGPLSTEVTATVVLTFIPVVVPVTLTDTVQLRPASRVTPNRLMVLLPGRATIVPEAQLLCAALGVATASPAGRLSMKLTPVSDVRGLGLARAKLNDVVPLSGMVATSKSLAIVGAAGAVTVMLAEAGEPEPPWFEVAGLVKVT